MSQYPPPTGPQGPYSAPGLGYFPPAGIGGDPVHASRAPARRAAIALFIIGLMMASCSGLCLGITFTGVIEEGISKQPNVMAQMNQAGLTIQMFKTMMAVFSGLACFAGLVFIALGWPLWKGSMFAAVTSLVLTILMTLGFALMAVAQALGHDFVTALVAGVLPTIIFVALSVMLVLAIRSITVSKSHAAAMQAQWMQYQQQYYAQSMGSAYAGQQQPPPPPPPVQPPQ